MSDISTHQRELAAAFAWVRRVYEQAWALRNASEALLDGFGWKKKTSSWRTEAQPESSHRFVYLDVDWYVPPGEATDSLLVLAFDYTSSVREGCYLHVATCTLRDHVERVAAERASLGEMVNMAIRLKGMDGRFDVNVGAGGLAEAQPTNRVWSDYRKYVGDFHIKSASFPVAWIDSHTRLLSVIEAGTKLVLDADDVALQQLQKAAIEAHS